MDGSVEPYTNRDTLQSDLKSAASRVSFASTEEVSPVRVSADVASAARSSSANLRLPLIDVDASPERLPLWKEGAAWASGVASIGLHALLLVGFVMLANRLGEIPTERVTEAIRATLGDEEIADDSPLVPIADVPAFELAPSAAAKVSPAENVARLTEEDLTSRFAASQFEPSMSSLGESEQGADQADGRGVRFALPNSGRAVTKGSFTVWTEPSDPQPKQDYYIVMNIRVPPKLEAFPKSDLLIEVRGTDRFHLKLPDPRYRFFRPGDLPVVDGQAQLVLWIPGGNANVRDEIRVESVKILNEKQVLEITF